LFLRLGNALPFCFNPILHSNEKKSTKMWSSNMWYWLFVFFSRGAGAFEATVLRKEIETPVAMEPTSDAYKVGTPSQASSVDAAGRVSPHTNIEGAKHAVLDTEAMVSPLQDQKSAADTLMQDKSDTTFFCSDESKKCTCLGDVKYGKNLTWTWSYGEMGKSFTCGKGYFGKDPLYGTLKECRCKTICNLANGSGEKVCQIGPTCKYVDDLCLPICAETGMVKPNGDVPCACGTFAGGCTRFLPYCDSAADQCLAKCANTDLTNKNYDFPCVCGRYDGGCTEHVPYCDARTNRCLTVQEVEPEEAESTNEIVCTVTVPENGSRGTCFDTLAAGSSCTPTCDEGYTLSGDILCSDDGMFGSSTCDEATPEAGAANATEATVAWNDGYRCQPALHVALVLLAVY